MLLRVIFVHLLKKNLNNYWAKQYDICYLVILIRFNSFHPRTLKPCFSSFHSNKLNTVFFQEPGEGKNSADCRDSEIKKWQLAPLRKMGQPVLPRRSSEEKSEKIPKETTTVICTGEKGSKPGSKTNKD